MFQQNPVRWLTPKSPPFAVDEDTPVLLDDLLKYFLPKGLSTDQKESERQLIYRFIRDLNQIRKEYLPKDFTNSYVVNNVSSLTESYPFVSAYWQQDRLKCVIGLFVVTDELGGITAEQLDGTDCGAKFQISGEFEVTSASAFDQSNTQFAVAVVYLKCFACGTSNAAHMYQSYGEEYEFNGLFMAF